ncbi:MAG: D-glycero-alpha-D-manno-heptose-1,7-bisphosphate 7-phosphatase [Ferruginibacter sp.]
MPIPINNINAEWTLFLDRDGVINHEIPNDYVHQWKDFVFYEGVPESIVKLSKIFKYVIVITNQRGVGRGITKEENLIDIHQHLQATISKAGGKIDQIYYCTAVEASHPNRKPNSGMGLQAKLDYPDIDFSKTIMVGNSMSDMEFGKNIGAYTVFLKTTKPHTDLTSPLIDQSFSTLTAFAQQF